MLHSVVESKENKISLHAIKLLKKRTKLPWLDNKLSMYKLNSVFMYLSKPINIILYWDTESHQNKIIRIGIIIFFKLRQIKVTTS